MKKIISMVLVLAVLALAFCACGKENTGVPDGMKLVENDKNTYKLFVPENWVVNIADGISGAYVANDNSNISLMIMTASKNYQSLESFCQKYYKDMEATFKNVSEREEYTENQKFGQLPKKSLMQFSSNICRFSRSTIKQVRSIFSHIPPRLINMQNISTK